MNRDSPDSNLRWSLLGSIGKILLHYGFAGLFLITFPWVGVITSLALSLFFGFQQWGRMQKYVKPRGKEGLIGALVGINCQIGFGLFILSLYVSMPVVLDPLQGVGILDLFFGLLCIPAPGMVVGGLVCGIMLIGSLIRRGADRRLIVDWLPTTILYVAMCVYVLWGVWAVRSITSLHRGGEYRSRAARVQSDMHNIQSALQAYAIDRGVYPPPVSATGSPLVFSATAPAAGCVSVFLTTPIAYLSELPTDHFSKKGGSLSYRYVTDGTASLLVSVGPDGVLDCPLDKLPGILKSKGTSFAALLAEWASTCQYDASNGTLSKGDILWIGP